MSCISGWYLEVLVGGKEDKSLACKQNTICQYNMILRMMVS